MQRGAKPLTNGFGLAVAFALAIAVISSPISSPLRRARSLLPPPNFLRRNFADCTAHVPTGSTLTQESLTGRPIVSVHEDEEKVSPRPGMRFLVRSLWGNVTRHSVS